jgi:predicted nucleic acid binding AN1-type Zn finger protein
LNYYLNKKLCIEIIEMNTNDSKDINSKDKYTKPLKCNLDECTKKLQLTDFKCKCSNTYCSKHRLPETHKCNYDYKTYGRNLLDKQNQPCIAKKIVVL